MSVHACVLQAAKRGRATEQPHDARAFRLTPIIDLNRSAIKPKHLGATGAFTHQQCACFSLDS
jgi:hypothetical protein